ncbi:urea ABC transporter ATP-binding protein UrtD [Comamonadaceae bacterium SL12-8]|uniref:Urea ABC transporter ATP-binding protein UrtD n=2 Tax=Amphibiibacter pelophylacis TaxID=1799477 RepID=A0ACC6P1Q2_9BURK
MRPVTEGELDVVHGDILYIEDLSVHFGTFRAINALNLYVRDLELRCVIGPNGAGKTTLMDVITGKTHRRNARIDGQVFLGQALDALTHSEAQIAQAGVGRKFQKPTVCEHLAVWENLELTQSGSRHWWHHWRARLDAGQKARIQAVLEQIRLEDSAFRLAGELSHGQKQRLEIGMLLMQQPRLLLLDEPAAGLSDEETAELADLILGLRGQCAMLVIEHDMDFVARLAGETGLVSVLAEGALLAQGTLAQVRTDPRVMASYLGRG